MIHGLIQALSPQFMVWLTAGVLAGMVIGCLPGLTATMGVALLVPFTFDLPAGAGLAMLGALYVCAMFSDAIPAVLVNTPGTPAAMATTFDGYPMTLQGRAQAAIVASCFSAALGAMFGAAVYLLLARPLASVALRFGPPEFFWIGVFALTIIGSLAGKSMLKGIGGGAIGMLISTIGISQTGDVSRFTFGIPELRGGVSLVAALVGVYAVPQVLSMVCERRQKEYVAEYRPRRGVALQTVREVIAEPVHFLRSALIGTFVGLLPGAGSPVAALVSYNEAVRWSKDKSRYGKGDLRGVTASEIANNACAPASMIPLVTLGVPGSAPAAVVGGALLLHGLNPGPDLFQSNGTLVYSFGWSLMLAGVMTFILGTLLSPWLARMVRIPLRLLAPLIMLLAVIGAYAIRNNIYDDYIMLGLGLFTFLVRKLDFHPGPIGLGLILGHIVEPALVQSIYLSDASSYGRVFFGSTVDVVLIMLTVLSVAWVLWTRIKESRQARTNKALEGSAAVTVDVAEDAMTEAAGLRRGVDRDLVGALVLFFIGGVALSAMGTGMQDWIFPRVLTYLILILAVLLVSRVALAAVTKRAPDIMRRSGDDWGIFVDVLVFCAIVLAYVLVIDGLGFWLSSFLMLSLASIYLTPRKTLHNVGLAVVVPVVACVLAYVVFQHLLYVPVPEATWWTGVG